MFRKVSYSFLNNNLKRAGIHQQVEGFRTITLASEVLRERFGEGVASHANPRSIKNRTLAIEIAHPAVAEEIRRCEEALISEMNNRLGRPEILRFVFVTKQAREEY